MITASTNLFNLTRLISFDNDRIAEDDVVFLEQELKCRAGKLPVRVKLQGGHFEPLKIYVEELAKCIDTSFEELRSQSNIGARDVKSAGSFAVPKG